jgi:hypothetical protein
MSASTCEPGAVQECYSGAEGTLGVGLCKPGYRVCDAEGNGYGPCEGETTPAPEVCVTSEDEDCDAAIECPGQHIFSMRFGENITDVRDTAVDSQGNVFVMGESNGPVDFGGGLISGKALYIAKLDPLGSHVWTKRYDGYFGDHGAIAADADDNILITVAVADTFDFGGGPLPGVNSRYDLAVVKLDAAGSHVLSKRFDAGKDLKSSRFRVAADAAGNIVLAGSFVGTLDFGGGPLTATPSGDPSGYDPTIFVAKLGPLGSHLFSHRFGEGSAGVSRVAITDDGGVALTGAFNNKIDFGGGPFFAPGPIDYRDYLVKLDASGNHVFSKSYLAYAGTTLVAAGPAGSIIYGGSDGTAGDFGGGVINPGLGFAAKLDGSAGHIWSRNLHAGPLVFGDGHNLHVRDLAADSLGGVSLAGEFNVYFDPGGGPIAGTNDAFIVKLGPAGELAWGKGFGDSEYQRAVTVDVDATGSVVIAGVMSGSVDFGGGVLVSEGLEDGFVAKFAP